MDKTVEFPCKEQGCQLKVCYDRRTSPGGLGALLRKNGKPDAGATVGAYLVCADGHVHRYDVPVAKGGS